MREKIQKTLENALQGAQIEVIDARGDGRHFKAVIVAEQFEGLPLFKQHKLVMDSLKSLFDDGLHALSLKTYTPGDYARSN